MAWLAVPGTDGVWEYNNAPSDPGGALTKMWEQQTNGIRTIGLSTVYTNVRHAGTTEDVGELSKTYWDARI